MHGFAHSDLSHLTKVNGHFVYFINICHFSKMIFFFALKKVGPIMLQAQMIIYHSNKITESNFSQVCNVQNY